MGSGDPCWVFNMKITTNQLRYIIREVIDKYGKAGDLKGRYTDKKHDPMRELSSRHLHTLTLARRNLTQIMNLLTKLAHAAEQGDYNRKKIDMLFDMIEDANDNIDMLFSIPTLSQDDINMLMNVWKDHMKDLYQHHRAPEQSLDLATKLFIKIQEQLQTAIRYINSHKDDL